MPTMRETAINRPLTGTEMRELLRRDFERLLANEGSLSNHIAYGRVAWQIVLRLHTANPVMPLAESHIESRGSDPTTPNVETPPLDGTTDADSPSIGGTTLQRTVTRPNYERVREGLPVPVEVRQQDGTKTVEQVVYPKPPDHGEGDVHVTDTTADAKAAFGKPSA